MIKGIRRKVSLSEDWWDNKTHVLLDMDGTLIPQPGALFNNLLILGLCFKFRRFGSAKNIIKAFLKIRELVSSGHSFSTNKEAFTKTLAKELGTSLINIDDLLNKFFDSEYPLLCLFLHKEPAARKLIDLLRFAKKHITLATNPIFGSREIELRLKASDLYLHDFDLVTSWDVMATTKPNHAFFFDTLGKINVKPENAVMIGNDPYYDLPAHDLGIQTLLVGKYLTLEDITESLENNLKTNQVL